MKDLKIGTIIVLAMTVVLFTACSADNRSDGRGQVALSITFPGTVQRAAAAQSLRDLITELTLNVIPAHSASLPTVTVDLLASFNKTGSNSYTINGLADSETYVFQITAFADDGDSFLYAGQALAKIAPVGVTPVSIVLQTPNLDFNFLAFGGIFNDVASVSDGSHISLVANDFLGGTYTRNAPNGPVSGNYFSVPTSQLNIFDMIFLAPGTGTSLLESGRGTGDATPLSSSLPPKLDGTLTDLGGQHLTFRSL